MTLGGYELPAETLIAPRRRVDFVGIGRLVLAALEVRNGEGFRVPQAYESLSCRNPRAAREALWGFRISADGGAGRRTIGRR